MIIGVSSDPTSVRMLNAYQNLGREDTWVYSRVAQHFGMVSLGRTRIDGDNHFIKGDSVTIYIDADNREVCWYRNGKFVACNLPGFPLAEAENGYGIYVQVDNTNDRVQIIDYGYKKPFEDKQEDVLRWENPLIRLNVQK